MKGLPWHNKKHDFYEMQNLSDIQSSFFVDKKENKPSNNLHISLKKPSDQFCPIWQQPKEKYMLVGTSLGNTFAFLAFRD